MITRMVRTPGTKDLPGVWKHLRFEPGKGFSGNSEETSRQHAELLKAFPGVRAIVLHLRGQTGEHPHLHVWWESDISGGIVSESVRKRLRSYNDVFTKYSGQMMWSMRNHDNYEIWCKYVCKNGSHQVLLGDELLLATSVESKQLLVAEPYTPQPYDKVILKKPTAEERLIKYCESLGWVRGDHFHPEQGTGYWQRESKRAVIDYSNNRVNNGQLVYMVRNVMFVFGDEDVKKWLRENTGREINFFS